MTTQTPAPKTLAGRGAALATKGSAMIRTTIASFLKPANSPAEDLQAQLAGARALLDEERARQLAAEAAFDVDGSAAAEAELRAAVEATARAELYYARAERNAVQQAELAKEAERVALESRCDVLRSALRPNAISVLHAPLARVEADLLINLALVRASRMEIELDVDKKRAELSRVLEQLGREHFVEVRHLVAPTGPVLAALGAFCAERPMHDLARLEVERLARAIDPRFVPFSAARASDAAE